MFVAKFDKVHRSIRCSEKRVPFKGIVIYHKTQVIIEFTVNHLSGERFSDRLKKLQKRRRMRKHFREHRKEIPSAACDMPSDSSATIVQIAQDRIALFTMQISGSSMCALHVYAAFARRKFLVGTRSDVSFSIQIINNECLLTAAASLCRCVIQCESVRYNRSYNTKPPL